MTKDLLSWTENEEGALNRRELRSTIIEALNQLDLSGHLLCIIPDSTRTMPVPVFFETMAEELSGEVEQLDFLIALGTHPPMSSQQVDELVGMSQEERDRRYGDDVNIFNHEWDSPSQLSEIGEVSSSKLSELSDGLLKNSIPVRVNKRLLKADHAFIVGPVFPHEVVGFSGGYKYLFPGISGPELIDAFHWLAALATNPKTIGFKDTAPQQVLQIAGSYVPTPITAFQAVMEGHDPRGLYVGDVRSAWSSAVDLAKECNIVYKDKPFETVLSVVPEMYEELWTGGKGMYKLEPVVADGGRLILYAPHIDEVSRSHGDQIKEVGYHTRDYFLKQPDSFSHISGAVKAHCTHVKGIGTYENGVEKPRITVELATGLSPEVCEQINLDYRDPDSIDPEDFKGREDEGVLYVPRAGEQLFRLSDGTSPDIDEL